MGSALPVEARLAALQKLMPRGWDWSGYAPLLETALHRQMPVVAANISREALRTVSRTGFEALGRGEAARLGLDSGWSAARQDLMSQEIFEGHCKVLPPDAVLAISKAQRARDAVMADRMLTGASSQTIAILGRGHVRLDMAVPIYLRQRMPAKRVVSIDLAETVVGAEPQSYAITSLGLAYDYVAFTATSVRTDDPCAALRTPAPSAKP